MLTKLEIINAMLAAVGEQVVNDVDIGNDSVIQALSIFDSENLEFQAQGWSFNQEYALPLAPNTDGEVAIPLNTLAFMLASTDRRNPSVDKLRYVARANKIYDQYTHSFIIGKPVYADLMMLVDPETMPAVASVYLKHKCALQMYVSDDGDATKFQMLDKRVQDAWKALKRSELKFQLPNIASNPMVQLLRYRMDNRANGNSLYTNYPIHTFPGH